MVAVTVTSLCGSTLDRQVEKQTEPKARTCAFPPLPPHVRAVDLEPRETRKMTRKEINSRWSTPTIISIGQVRAPRKNGVIYI